MSKLAIVVLAALVKCTPAPSTEGLLAECMTHVSPPPPLGDVTEHERRYLRACMRYSGYDVDTTLADCNRLLSPVTTARCYGPIK
jgi:hypothetical protein